jgi:antitoxin (DNA-binding transcriptional repressor) of toxin-antitoxin stability system
MTTLELSQHPELQALVAAIRQGDSVEIVDHGHPVVRCVPTPESSNQRLWLSDLATFRASLGINIGRNAVLDMRAEDET